MIVKKNTAGFPLSLLALLSILVLTGGCGTLQNATVRQSQEKRLKLYAREVRWGNLEALPAYLSPDLTAKQGRVAANPENIRVIEYEVVVPPAKVGENESVQTVQIQYLHRDRQVVRTLMDRQNWKYEPETKQWFRNNLIPEFK